MLNPREELLLAKSGFPTARCNGILLHSLYDPMREAEEYLRSLNLPSRMKTILVLGSGLGYLEHCLSSLYPEARVLSIQFSTFFEGKEIHSLPSFFCFYPGSNRSVEDFLYERIEGPDFQELQIITWKPSYQAYPHLAQSLSEQVLQALREMGRSLQTTFVFGRRWILNSIKNFLFHPPVQRFCTIPHPICIAASGPSLALNLPYLRQYRNRFILWALPSSLLALREHDIWPDLTLMTDAGNYATHLLHFYLRNRQRKEPFLSLAFPLTAAFFSPHPSVKPIWFSQGTGIEKLFLPHLPFPLEDVPPHGTVAGTALELALKITTGPVVFVGLDLSIEGFWEHVRPHPFEKIFEVQVSRLQGSETPFLRRVLGQYPEKLDKSKRTSPVLQTYAGWFRKYSHRWENRVFRISPSPVDTGMEGKPPSFLGTFPPVSSSFLYPVEESVSFQDRKRMVREILEKIQHSLPTVDPDIAKAFDLARSEREGPLDPKARLQSTLERILVELGGDS